MDFIERLTRRIFWSLLVVMPFGSVAIADSEQKIAIPSYTPKTMFALARAHRDEWAQQSVTGVLTLPKSTTPVPVIVLSHGSAGVGPALNQWVDAMSEIGVGTLVVDSFAPRGVISMVADQAQLSPAANLMDAFQALKILSLDSRVDATRIGIMGFSKGGEVAFRSALEPLRKAVLGADSDLKFALHIPVYAGCNQVYWSPKTDRSPILNLVGVDDDYTGAAGCIELASKYEKAGNPVRTIEYAGAGHAWDSKQPYFYIPEATSSRSCGVVRWDIETWAIEAESQHKKLDASEAGPFLAACTKRGVHYGRNDSAFRKSRSDVQAFIRQTFNL